MFDVLEENIWLNKRNEDPMKCRLQVCSIVSFYMYMDLLKASLHASARHTLNDDSLSISHYQIGFGGTLREPKCRGNC